MKRNNFPRTYFGARPNFTHFSDTATGKTYTCKMYETSENIKAKGLRMFQSTWTKETNPFYTRMHVRVCMCVGEIYNV